MFRTVLIAATAALAAFTLAPVTYADPDPDPGPDPHIPNMAVNYCPNGGPKWLWVTTYCDGMPYADGSYWRIVRSESSYSGGYYEPPSTSPMKCVVNPGGGVVPQPAPPGGCDGAVQ
jgi:hypothetical protein